VVSEPEPLVFGSPEYVREAHLFTAGKPSRLESIGWDRQSDTYCYPTPLGSSPGAVRAYERWQELKGCEHPERLP
jgi:hypothetical protein